MSGLPSPTPIRVEIAPNADPDDPTTWQWVDISDDVRYADGITIEYGRRDEGEQVDTTNCTLTLDNREGNYSPRNALGRWYRQIGRNTPLRVRWRLDYDEFGTDETGSWGVSDQLGATWQPLGAGGSHTTSNYNVTDGEASHTLPEDAAYRACWMDTPTLDADVTCTARLPVSVVVGGAIRLAGIMLRVQDIFTYYRCEVEVSTSGAISARIVRVSNGQDVALAQMLTELTHSATQSLRVRAQVSGRWLRMKVWPAGEPEPTEWAVEAQSITIATPGGVGIRTGVGAGNTNLPFTAYYSDVEVYVDRFVGYVTEWPTRWDKTGANAFTPIQATGVLRRLQQGQKPISSTLYQRIMSDEAADDRVAYWPLEDGAGTTKAGSPVPGVPPMRVVGFDFEAASDLAGSAPLPTMGPGSLYDARVPFGRATGEWHVEFVTKFDEAPNVNNLIWIETTGSGQPYKIAVQDDAISLTAINSAGDEFISRSAIPLDFFGRWVRVALMVSQTGGTVDWVLRWFPVGSDGWVIGGSFSGSAGVVTRVSLSQRGSGASECAFGHVSVWRAADVPYYFLADTGRATQPAGVRMSDLSTEAGVPLAILGDMNETEIMGPRRPSTYLELMRDAETADGGILHELDGGLAYVTRRSLYNQPVSLALDVDAGDIAETPEPTDDDQQIRNDVTVTRPGGSSARWVDEDSVAAVGTYDDSVEVNVDTDAQLLDVASWRVHLGTVDEMRWPRLNLQLHRNPHLIAPWLATRIGGRVTVSHDLPQLQGVDIDLLVDGWTETINLYTWDVELNCSPASPWKVATLDDTELGRLDSDGSWLAEDVDDEATTMRVTSDRDAPRWTEDGDEFPLDVRVGGEVMTVTDIGPSFVDTFSRDTTGGWGTSDSGEAWSTQGGSASDYLTTLGIGRVAHTDVGTRRFTFAGSFGDVELVGQITNPPLPTGAGILAGYVARAVDAGTGYHAWLNFMTSGGVLLNISRRVSGAFTTLATHTFAINQSPGNRWWIRFQVIGSIVRARAWLDGTQEPRAWLAEATDTQITAPGKIGTHSVLLSGNTNTLPVNIHYDNLTVTNPQTFTVQRGTGGFSRDHDAGTEVHVAQPVPLAR